MKKYIHVTKEVRQELAKVFKVGDRTVRNALLFDKDRGDTDCAKRIRMFALQKGGIVMAVVPEVEVLYDYDGMISQYFPNGAKLETHKSTGNTELFYKGECVSRWDNIKLRDMDNIQQLAAQLTPKNLDTMLQIVSE